MAKTT